MFHQFFPVVLQDFISICFNSHFYVDSVKMLRENGIICEFLEYKAADLMTGTIKLSFEFWQWQFKPEWS